MTKKSSAVNKAIKTGKRKPKVAKKQVKKGTAKTVVKLSNKQLNDMLSQARELQWAGQHEQPIEVCTQALDAIGKGNSRTAQIQMDLLDTRSESYYALIKPDPMQKDAKLMMRIANAAPSSPKAKKLVLKAQALIWKSRIHRFIDKNLKLAKKTIVNAHKTALKSENKLIEAKTLRNLSIYQVGDQSVKTAQQAVEIFQSLGEQRELARELGDLAWAQVFTGQSEEAHQHAQTALL